MLDPVLFSIGPLAVRWYGACMAAAVGTGFYYLRRDALRKGYDEDFIYNLALLVVVAGIIGARAVYVATNWSYYASLPWTIIRLDFGGLSFHGAVLGGVLAALPYLRRHRASFNELADLAVPGLATGIALVRWANIINGEVMGRVTSSGFQHPAQVYGSAIGVALLISHNILARKKPPAGYLFWSFALYYSLLRGLVEETFRANPLYALGLVIDSIGAGFFTLTQLVTPAFVALSWWMRRRVMQSAGRGEERGQ